MSVELRINLISLLKLLQGKASDMKIVTDEILRLKSSLIDIYVKHTGMPADKIGKIIQLFQKYFK